MSYIPGKGDIVTLNFDPGVGKEIMQYRPALVLSPEKFNDQMGFAYVAPISSTIRGMGLEVAVPKSLATTGVVQTWQIRSFDWVDGRVEFVEKTPEKFVDEVLEKVGLILGIRKR